MTDTIIDGQAFDKAQAAALKELKGLMPKKGSRWRDRIRVHPAANLLPMMERKELEEMAASIKAEGLHVPVVYFVTKQGERLLLDGRNRFEASDMAGLPLDTEGKIVNEGAIDPYVYVISANIKRRHLTTEQRRDLAAKVIAARPDKSDRAIAKEVGVSHSTVAKVRKTTEANGQNGHKSGRVEASGRKSRGRKPGQVSAKKQQPRIAIVDQAEPKPDPALWSEQANRVSGVLDEQSSSTDAMRPALQNELMPPSASSPEPTDTSSAPAKCDGAMPPSRLEQWKQLALEMTPEEFTAAKVWWHEFIGSSVAQ
jgi:hypothetical protein